MSRGRTGRSSTYPGGTETIVWRICSYQVTAMVGTNTSTHENHKLYNSMVQAISIVGGECSTKVGSLYARFVDMGSPVKTQLENGLCKILDFRGHTIDVFDPSVFILKDPVLHD